MNNRRLSRDQPPRIMRHPAGNGAGDTQHGPDWASTAEPEWAKIAQPLQAD